MFHVSCFMYGRPIVRFHFKYGASYIFQRVPFMYRRTARNLNPKP
jgi:hypothetical protein